jgi:hypothetical protein
MTPQEQQLIDGLISRIRSTPPTEKDDEVDRYLHQNLDSIPDSLYMLVQTVLVQQYGLQNAQEQLEALKQELDEAHSQQRPPKKSGSFLGRIFGSDNQQQPPQQGYQPVNAGYPPPPPLGAQGYQQPGYGPGYGQPPYGQPMYPEPGYGGGSSGGGGFGGGGGFLRSAMQTAAGVAAGEMAFRGIEDLFHGFGHEEHGFDRPAEVVNNYYDGDRPEGHEHHAESRFSDSVNDASNQPISSDIEDRRGFADTGDNLANNDQQGFEDSNSNDDGNFDDSGSFDDGGSYDDNSN